MKKIISLIAAIAMTTTISFGATFTKVSGGHSISINVDSGKAVKIRALDIFGKIFNGWTIIGATVNDQSQKEIEITIGENDVTATANYLTPYTITVNQTANGVISPSTVTVGEGTNQVFTITPNTSHKIVDVLLDGTSVLSSLVAGTGNEKTYTLSNIQGNHILTASFKSAGSSNSSTTSMGTPNAPVLASGLTPVNWDGSSWVNTTEDNWDYNYNSVVEAIHGSVSGNGNGKWANAQTADGSLYVWIPRYSYKITSGNHNKGKSWNSLDNSGTNKIEVKFSNGTTDDTSDNYITHPAFTFGTDELKGLWVAKYEASQGSTTNRLSAPTSSTSVAKSIPGVTSWTNITVSKMFDYAYNTYRNADSHLMKNSEWGAVAYLTNAIGRIPYINNYFISDTIKTGYAGNSQNASNATSILSTCEWNTSIGVKASTTHNVYGIYDMSGGAEEYVAAYGYNASRSYVNSLKSAASKYKEIYTKDVVDKDGDAYSSAIHGDAVYETSMTKYVYNARSTSIASWDGNFSYAPDSGDVFLRGGNYNSNSGAGVFAFNNSDGGSYSHYGFRVVLGIK